jgi:hypothetical protein
MESDSPENDSRPPIPLIPPRNTWPGAYPHAVVLTNRQALENWLGQGGPASRQPLLLRPDSVFETVWIPKQPEKPVPI